MDWLGAFFSLMALVAQQTFDVLGGVLYICCIMLEAGIFLSHFIWLVRTRKLRKQAKDAGIDFDDLPGTSKYRVAADRDPEVVGGMGGDKEMRANGKKNRWWRKGTRSPGESEEIGTQSPGLVPDTPISQDSAAGSGSRHNDNRASEAV